MEDDFESDQDPLDIEETKDNSRKKAAAAIQADLIKQLNSIKVVKREGFTIVDPDDVVPVREEVHASIREGVYCGRGDVPSPFSILDKLMDDDLVKLLLFHINAGLERQKSESIAKDTSRYNPISRDTFFRYFVEFWRKHLLASGTTDKESKVLGDIPHLVGTNRYIAIHATLKKLPESFFAEFLTLMHRAIDRFFILGNVSVVDESLYAYNGRDAKSALIHTTVPPKPHPDGIIEYVVAQLLRLSKIPIPIGFQQKTPSNIRTPIQYMYNLVRDIKKRTPLLQTIVCDSGFGIMMSKSVLKSLQFTYLASFKKSGASTAHSLMHIATPTKPGQFRMLSHDNEIYEYYKSNQFINNTITNAWKVRDAPKSTPVQPPRKIYDIAVILATKLTTADIIQLFKLDREKHCMMGIVEVIQCAINVDILAPPPGTATDGVWTENLLTNECTTEHLKILATNLLLSTPVSSKKKKDLVQTVLRKDIVTFDEDGNDTSMPVAKLMPQDIENQKKAVVGPCRTSGSIHQYYLDRYYYIDYIDKVFYKQIKPAVEGSWQALFACANLYYLTYLAFAFHKEACLTKQQFSRGSEKSDLPEYSLR
eukprot:gene21394-25701_t